MRQPPPDINSLIKDNQDPQEPPNKLSEFMRLLANPEDECAEDDCDDLACPVCGSSLETVFGSLPLKVQCLGCGRKFRLRQLLSLAP